MIKQFEHLLPEMQFKDAVKAYGVRGLASKLGITPAYVSMIANGKRALTPALLTQLSNLVNGVNRSGVNNSYVSSNEPGGIRTHDPRIKSPLLYQLSYRPIFSFAKVSICHVVSGSQRVALVLTSRGFDTLILSLRQRRCNSSAVIP